MVRLAALSLLVLVLGKTLNLKATNMRSLKFLSLGLAVASCFIGAIANAQITYQGRSLYRVGSELYVAGAKDSNVTVQFARIPVRVVVTANDCGVAVVKKRADDNINPEATVIEHKGNTFSSDELEQKILPNCVNGALTESRTENFRISENSIALVGNQPFQPVAITYYRNIAQQFKINGCGFFRIRSTAARPYNLTTRVSLNGATWPISDLPDAGIPARCFKSEIGPIPFVPVDWK